MKMAFKKALILQSRSYTMSKVSSETSPGLQNMNSACRLIFQRIDMAIVKIHTPVCRKAVYKFLVKIDSMQDDRTSHEDWTFW